LGQHMPRNYQPLDFTRPLADSHQARVPVDALDLVLAAVSVTAVDLDGVPADALGHFSGVKFTHGGFLAERPPFLLEPGGVTHG